MVSQIKGIRVSTLTVDGAFYKRTYRSYIKEVKDQTMISGNKSTHLLAYNAAN